MRLFEKGVTDVLVGVLEDVLQDMLEGVLKGMYDICRVL